MIFSRTPFRISLFGGGSDYPEWYCEHGGKVVGMAIDKHCYISMRELPPFFEHRHRIVHSKIELVSSVDEIQHPAIRGVLEYLPPEVGLQIHHDGDLPARAGLGSSSSFTVGLIHLVKSFYGQETTKEELADAAIHIERDLLKEYVGSQDQVWAAHGGLNQIDFNTDNSFGIKPLMVSNERRQELVSNLMLVFSGYYRFASEIAEKQIANFGKRQTQIHRMMEMVDEAVEIIETPSTPITDIGHMLNDAWKLKRELANEITTPALDEIMEAAMAAGALGGKILGAGGGGFMLFFVEPEKRAKVRKALHRLIEVEFDIDDQGSKIISSTEI